MLKKLALALAFFAIGAIATVQAAADRATPDEAKAMALKAAEFLKSNGPEKAFPEFNKSDGQFRDRDLYVAVNDEKGTTVAHGTIPALIGRNNLNLKDVEGKAFVQEMLAVKDQGWVEYKWPNPTTKAVETKQAYIVRVDTFTLVVGAYKN